MRSTICHICIPLAGLRQSGQLVVPLILQRLRACRCADSIVMYCSVRRRLHTGFGWESDQMRKRTKERTGSKWPRVAINPLDSGVRGIITNPRILSELNLAQRLTLRAFLRSFAGALDGDPQQTSGEESVVRLLSFTMGSAIESLHCQSH